MHRRDFHRLVVGSAVTSLGMNLGSRLLGASSAAANELTREDLKWTSRAIKFEPEPEHDSPPVIAEVVVQKQGENLIIVGDDHLVRMCNKFTGEITAKLRGHTDWVRCATYDPTETKIYTSGNDRRILTWDAIDGSFIGEIDQQTDAIVALAIDPTGQRLATAGFQDQVMVYDLATGRITVELECPCDDMRTVTFSPSGNEIIASGRSGVIRIWDSVTGEKQRDIAAHRRRVHRVLVADDGDQIISCAEDRTIKLFSLSDNTVKKELPRRPCKINSVALLGDQFIASGGSDNLIRLWDRKTLEEVHSLVGHRGTITSLCYDGNLLYSGSYDTELRIWTSTPDVARAIPQLGNGSPSIR